MKFLILFAAVLFSLNSFAYLEDFPIPQAEKNLSFLLNQTDPTDIEDYLVTQNVLARGDSLKWTGAQVIYKREEYLSWQAKYTKKLERLIDFFDLVLTKPISETDKKFARMGGLVSKRAKFLIESNSIDFAKFVGDTSSRPNMMNIWPGDVFVVNVEKMDKLSALDDRAYMVTFFHELIHSYYTDPGTRPSGGPDYVAGGDPARLGDCRYQEGLAYGAQSRLYKLLDSYDRGVDPSAISPAAAAAMAAWGDSAKWSNFINWYCGVGVAK